LLTVNSLVGPCHPERIEARRRCQPGGTMNARTVAAILLIIGGVLVFAYKGITFTTREKVVDMGPVEITREDKERIPLSPILGGLALASGVVLLVTRTRSSS
jgi:hypothetical protein